MPKLGLYLKTPPILYPLFVNPKLMNTIRGILQAVFRLYYQWVFVAIMFLFLYGIDPGGEPGGWFSFTEDLTVFSPVIPYGLGIMFAEDILADDVHIFPFPVLSITYKFGK